MLTRRHLLQSSAALMILPYAARAAGHSGDTFASATGEVSVFPVSHASFAMTTPMGTVYNDPVGDPAKYADLPAADAILVTHHHGDHFNLDTLTALMGDETVLITNPTVYDKLPADLQAQATALANGETGQLLGMPIEAIPAYNTTEDRTKYHPKGRDNGYVLTADGLRIYIAGDTEGTDEMRALTDIDVAFVPMNLPFTMDEDAAADAVAAFAPKVVYPYHYKNSDVFAFADALTGDTQIKMAKWYV